jgi:peroxiredoxin (alkyl hydroperoxide reductase subunit C)
VEDARFQENDAQVLGINVDSSPVQRAFCASLGNIPYPVLSDFNPRGKVAELSGVFNVERGMNRRPVVVIDKAGVVRFKHIYETGAPDPAAILEEVKSLG